MASRIDQPYRPVLTASPRTGNGAASTSLATGTLGGKKVVWLRPGTHPAGAAHANSGNAAPVKLSGRSMTWVRPGETGGKSTRFTTGFALALALREHVARLRNFRDED